MEQKEIPFSEMGYNSISCGSLITRQKPIESLGSLFFQGGWVVSDEARVEVLMTLLRGGDHAIDGQFNMKFVQ